VEATSIKTHAATARVKPRILLIPIEIPFVISLAAIAISRSGQSYMAEPAAIKTELFICAFLIEVSK